MKNLNEILLIYAIEHNAILSKLGDVTIVFEVLLPELFTMSNDEYEAFHHAWIKAIKVLSVNNGLHKQDWFTEAKYRPSFVQDDNSFLTRSSDRFFKRITL